MFCTRCGGGLAEDARFCVSCGAAVGPRVPPASDASAPPPFVAPASDAGNAERDAAGQTFVMNQKLISISGDLWIDDSNGTPVFEVDGKLLAVRRSMLLKDASGQELYEINKSLAHVHTTFEVKQGNAVVATIQKALVSMFGEHFTITAADGGQMKVTGNWMGREFHIQKDGTDVIVASRQFFSLHDAYGIQVSQGFDAALALAIVVALEQIEKEEGHESSPLGGLLGGGLGGILGS